MLAEHLELRLAEPEREVGSGSRPDSGGPDRTDAPSVHPAPELALRELDVSRVRTFDALLVGGELTPAVVANVRAISERLPALQGLTLTAMGTPHGIAASLGDELHAGLRQRGCGFAIDFVLDSNVDAFEALGAQDAAHPANRSMAVLEASRSLRARGVPVRWRIPVERRLAGRLEPLFSLARDEGVEPVLVTASIAHWPDTSLDGDDRRFVRDFIDYRLLGEERHLHAAPRRVWYRTLAAALADPDAGRPMRNHPVAIMAALDPGGAAGWTLRAESRPALGRFPEEWRVPGYDGAARQDSANLLEQAADAGGVLRDGGFALVQWLRARVMDRMRPDRAMAPGVGFGAVMLIGAYGGDHIGDTAILGGVLCRIHARHGTTRAILLSQRPEHTRHLVAMLDTPVAIEVEPYERATMRARLPEVDAVVFAGGPLIDLPKQLVRHLYAASIARRSGKPFLMEGIGPGPFARRPSEWVARRLVRLADRISVRTAADAGSPLMQGVVVEAGHDPAFDYLATRGAELTRLRAQDREWIERLLRDTDGRPLIGINVRPIRHLFTVGVPARTRAEYTRRIETQCEEQLAEGMRRFHRSCAAPPCFVFFPMNAIQFGSSDLRSAYRLKRQLDPGVDFRVWQADAGLDGVVALLRRLDAVVTMRFHATIFALAQRRRVIGIDYRIGKRDKVGDLLAGLGQSENCRRIDEITAEWLCARLSALTTGAQRTLLSASPEPNQ